MTLRNPELAALAPLMALLFALALGAHWRRMRRLARAFDAPALRRLFPMTLDRFPRARLVCLLVAGLAVGLAAAGPVRVGRDAPTPPLDLALVVDLSLSMGATDAPPSRIARARDLIDRLTEELPSVRFSLVTFAAWPLELVPPTDDAGIVRYFTDSLHVELVREPDRGSALGEALYLAGETLAERPRPDARRAVLVISDGGVQDAASVKDVVARLAADEIEIWTAGIGSRQGAAILAGSHPILDGGEPVVATLDASLLRGVAAAGGGRYQDVTEEPGLEALVASLRELSGDARADASSPIDASFLLTLLAVPLLLWDGAADAGRAIALPRRRRAPS